MRIKPVFICCFILLVTVVCAGKLVTHFADVGSAHPGGGDLATWVGAVSTMLAFAAAIWVPFRINQIGRKAEAERLKSNSRFMIKSIWAEVSTLSAGFERSIGHKIMGLTVDECIGNSYLPPDKPFSVFDGCASRLSEVQDDNLANHIIITYASLNGLLSFMRLNSEIERKILEAKGAPTADGAWVRKQTTLKTLQNQHIENRLFLKERYCQAQMNVKKLKHLIARKKMY